MLAYVGDGGQERPSVHQQAETLIILGGFHVSHELKK